MIIPLDPSYWKTIRCDWYYFDNRLSPFKIKSNLEYDYIFNVCFAFITDQDLEILIRVLSQEVTSKDRRLQLLPQWRTIGINEQKMISLGSELKKIGVWEEEWSSPLTDDCFLAPDSVLEAIKFVINQPELIYPFCGYFGPQSARANLKKESQ